MCAHYVLNPFARKTLLETPLPPGYCILVTGYRLKSLDICRLCLETRIKRRNRIRFVPFVNVVIRTGITEFKLTNCSLCRQSITTYRYLTQCNSCSQFFREFLDSFTHTVRQQLPTPFTITRTLDAAIDHHTELLNYI